MSPGRPSPHPRGGRPGPGEGDMSTPIYDETLRRIATQYAGGPGIGRHRLLGCDDITEEIPIMADHHDHDGDGVADHEPATCTGEDRADPDSWGDPDIFDAPWQASPVIEPGDAPILLEG